MNKRRFDDVVTNDIMVLKVSRGNVFSTPVCAVVSFSIFYITYINNRNNVTMSSAPVFRGFVDDVMVTLSSLCHSHHSHLSHSGLKFNFSGFQIRRVCHALS